MEDIGVKVRNLEHMIRGNFGMAMRNGRKVANLEETVRILKIMLDPREESEDYFTDALEGPEEYVGVGSSPEKDMGVGPGMNQLDGGSSRKKRKSRKRKSRKIKSRKIKKR